jgi:hypothetical protein
MFFQERSAEVCFSVPAIDLFLSHRFGFHLTKYGSAFFAYNLSIGGKNYLALVLISALAFPSLESLQRLPQILKRFHHV